MRHLGKQPALKYKHMLYVGIIKMKCLAEGKQCWKIYKLSSTSI